MIDRQSMMAIIIKNLIVGPGRAKVHLQDLSVQSPLNEHLVHGGGPVLPIKSGLVS